MPNDIGQMSSLFSRSLNKLPLALKWYNISQICDAIPMGMIGWRIFIYLAASNQHYYGKMIIRNSFSLGIASEVRISQRIKKYKISFCCSLKMNRRTTTTRMTISQGVRVEWLWLGYKKFSVWVIRKRIFLLTFPVF